MCDERREAELDGIAWSKYMCADQMSRAYRAAVVDGLTQNFVAMDADLQHPPHVIPELVDEWRKGNKIVHGVRLDNANTPRFKRVASKLFYTVYSFASGVDMQAGMTDFYLLDRQVIAGLMQLREEELFLRGLVQWIGFPKSKVVFR